MPPFWQNRRGEWYVIGQFVLFGLIFFGPRTLPGLPPWPAALVALLRPAGLVLLVAGLLLAGAGAIKLGRDLTPFVCPKAQAALVVGGAYRFVRHPIYSGLILLALGFTLLVHGWFTLGCTLLLILLLDRKARREELWLRARLPGYEAYSRTVKRFFPFIY